jgi:hypothetical protein
LTDRKSHPAGGNASKRRSEDAGTAMQCQHEDVESDELCGVLRYVALAW